MPDSRYADDLKIALDLADHADEITMARFQASDLVVESKPDLTPVSDADRGVEDMIRTALAARRPDDAIYGEERGSSGAGTRRWIIDPIDGTKNFVRNVPVWATLIALVDGSDVVVGVVSAPALGRRWWASQGGGAWEQFGSNAPHTLHVSTINALSEASLSYSSLTGWQQVGRIDEFIDLQARVWRTRAYGDFFSYMLVATGAVDVACEPELELYDMAALVPIVTEAGGRFTSLSGVAGPWGANALASNGLLHDQILDHFHWPKD